MKVHNELVSHQVHFNKTFLEIYLCIFFNCTTTNTIINIIGHSGFKEVAKLLIQWKDLLHSVHNIIFQFILN